MVRSPFPTCIIDEDGKVLASSRASEVFLYDRITDADIFILTNHKYEDYRAALAEDTQIAIEKNDRIFRVWVTESDENPSDLVLFFNDITDAVELRKRYERERACIAVIHLDNFDEVIGGQEEEKGLLLASEADKMIRSYFSEMSASLRRVKDDTYFAAITKENAAKLVETKFEILDMVRTLKTESELPLTLSIGVGIDGETLSETDQYALNALDLALGRGGDQAVVKDDTNINYYGGKTQTIATGNKGKSRVIAHAIVSLMQQAEKVVVMGHNNPDMDAFGAAIGIARIAKNVGVEAYVVVNNVTEALAEIYKQVKDSEVCNIINGEKALAITDENTLLVVVDTHRPSFADEPELINKTKQIAVIDHHRRSAEAVQDPTLWYVEPYASSSCELVSEMIQYAEKKKSVTRIEAEALLAGITVDTNNFAVKTGVRTFEAAAWLKRSGADPTAVKKFLQADAEALKIRSKCVAEAEINEEAHIAFSILDGRYPDAQILCAQAADSLLLIKDIKASFVAGINSAGITVISARSLGDVNVQVIMEGFGGGGHLTTAGAQVEIAPKEAIRKLKELFLAKEDN